MNNILLALGQTDQRGNPYVPMVTLLQRTRFNGTDDGMGVDVWATLQKDALRILDIHNKNGLPIQVKSSLDYMLEFIQKKEKCARVRGVPGIMVLNGNKYRTAEQIQVDCAIGTLCLAGYPHLPTTQTLNILERCFHPDVAGPAFDQAEFYRNRRVGGTVYDRRKPNPLHLVVRYW